MKGSVWIFTEREDIKLEWQRAAFRKQHRKECMLIEVWYFALAFISNEEACYFTIFYLISRNRNEGRGRAHVQCFGVVLSFPPETNPARHVKESVLARRNLLHTLNFWFVITEMRHDDPLFSGYQQSLQHSRRVITRYVIMERRGDFVSKV